MLCPHSTRSAVSCRNAHLRWRSVAAIAALSGAWFGCAPREFHQAITYYTDQERVRDASVRRTTAAWFLRFDAAALHDFDRALADADDSQARDLSAQALTRAEALAIESACNELARLSPAALVELARRADCAPDVPSLTDALQSRSRAALAAELATDHQMPSAAWRKRMRQIRSCVEPLPDDRERALRQVMLAGLSPAVAVGIADREREIVAAVRLRDETRVPRAAVWSPGLSSQTALSRWAPRVGVEWPATRDYPADYDRFGAVSLSGTRSAIRVCVEPARPTIYTYTSAATIRGRRCEQLNYVWWFSDRPAMSTNDPAAGHIDGGTLRLTLDGTGRPAIAEIILNCGCGHEVRVADDIEAAARVEFGAAVEGARYSCESARTGKHAIIVAGTFDRADVAARPTIILSAGTHEPLRFSLDADMIKTVQVAAESHQYVLVDYDVLDRLPIGDGAASMFGPDGLVHYAGRREGFLLAPSGMLSAGQPRKRGTQRIRWDEYLFDDPTLLARTLRLPAGIW